MQVEGYESEYGFTYNTEYNTYLIDVTITNKLAVKEVGNLSITKIVMGENNDTSEIFRLIVKFDDESLNGTFGDVMIENGVTTFNISANETVSITNLPSGIRYTIEEEKNEYELKVVTGSLNGIIESSSTNLVTLQNYKETESVSDTSDENDGIENPETGSMFPYYLIILIMVLCPILFMSNKFKKIFKL